MGFLPGFLIFFSEVGKEFHLGLLNEFFSIFLQKFPLRLLREFFILLMRLLKEVFLGFLQKFLVQQLVTGRQCWRYPKHLNATHEEFLGEYHEEFLQGLENSWRNSGKSSWRNLKLNSLGSPGTSGKISEEILRKNSKGIFG